MIANVVSNACEFSLVDQAVRLSAGVTIKGVEMLVIDRGPGIRDPRRRVPAQVRHGERGATSEENIALSVANGFIGLLHGGLRFEDTPGGGLTVVIELTQDSPSPRNIAPSE